MQFYHQIGVPNNLLGGSIGVLHQPAGSPPRGQGRPSSSPWPQARRGYRPARSHVFQALGNGKQPARPQIILPFSFSHHFFHSGGYPLGGGLKKSAIGVFEFGGSSKEVCPRFRGQSIPAKRRREAIQYCQEFAWPLITKGPPPCDEAFLDFLQGEGIFSTASYDRIHSPGTWWALFDDSPLCVVAKVMCQLPCTSASIERVWSHMGRHVGGRARLNPSTLAEETFLALNAKLLVPWAEEPERPEELSE